MGNSAIVQIPYLCSNIGIGRGMARLLRWSRDKHHGVAKVVIAGKLAIRLYWRLRSGQDHEQVKDRGWHQGHSVYANGHGLPSPTL